MAGSFFTYTGTYGKPNHHEIDIEHLGQDPRLVQFAYHTAGKHSTDNEYMLDFDATADLHNYGFKWSEKELVFYVDGRPVKTVTSDIPSKAGKLMINLWPGTREVQDWLGGYYSGGRQTATYDWVKYSPIDECNAKKGSVHVAAPKKPQVVVQPQRAASGKITAAVSSIRRGTHSSQDIPVVVAFQVDEAPKDSLLKMYFYTNKEWYQDSAVYKGPGRYEFNGSVWKGHKSCLGKPCGQNTSITAILRTGSGEEIETTFTIDRVR
jgi:beta-glucanase (GH16 family)